MSLHDRLGRRPSPPDERDYKMSALLYHTTEQSQLRVALDMLMRSRSSRTTKQWAKVATDAIEALQGVAPPPTPPPGVAGNPWIDKVQLDQEDTPHCVGFGFAHWGTSDPVNDNFTAEDGHAIYYACKEIDGEPQEENGTYVRSGAKVMKARGRIDAYVFADKMDDIKLWIQMKGPVVVGTDWTEDMFDPDKNGMVKPTGAVAGGHCYLLVEWTKDDVLTFQNSWGSEWGDNGYFRMSAEDWSGLLDADGEACAGLELPLTIGRT